MTVTTPWWKESSVYQIWPASYKDSNGDGVGDIKGIISTLDYVKSLGVDVVWLSPMYDSPQDDMGYDISDYEAVYPKYGNMEDMDTLITESHKRGLKLILDLVINHTSDQHAWFKESRSSKTNPKRDWFVWKPPKYDADGNRHPPNNWGSYFSGSAWQYDELTDEYYLHLYFPSQPDLNWENKKTRSAIYDTALKFWFDKGVDGFRIDTAGVYSKDQRFLDAPIVFPESEFQPCHIYHQNGPRIHEFHKEMFDKVTSKYDVMTVGEGWHASKEESLKYVSAKEKELNMMFLFNVVDLGCHIQDKFRFEGFELPDLKKALFDQDDLLKGSDAWGTIFMENHDQPRSISRFGNDTQKYHFKSGKLLALMLSSLSGTLFLYQGQEIGMSNVPREWGIEDFLDLNTINYYNKVKKASNNDPVVMKKLMDNINHVARDNARTPVQWDSSPHAGFTTGTPWMRVNDNYKMVNVESQVKDPNSLFSFWQHCLVTRKEYKDLLIHGSLEILDFDNKKTFTFVKEFAGKKAYVVLNFTAEDLKAEIPENMHLVNCNEAHPQPDVLGPYEGRVYVN